MFLHIYVNTFKKYINIGNNPINNSLYRDTYFILVCYDLSGSDYYILLLIIVYI